jgi:hypothetical protein
MDMFVKSVISILDEFDSHLLEYIKDLARKSCTNIINKTISVILFEYLE